MIFLWARVARDDPARRSAVVTYISTISIAQVFWVALAIVNLPVGATLASVAVFVALEMIDPSWQSAAREEHPGTRTTSQSAMAYLSSSRSARGPRYGRLDQRCRARRRRLDSRGWRGRLRRCRSHLRDLVDVLRDRVGTCPVDAPRAVFPMGLRPHREMVRPSFRALWMRPTSHVRWRRVTEGNAVAVPARRVARRIARRSASDFQTPTSRLFAAVTQSESAIDGDEGLHEPTPEVGPETLAFAPGVTRSAMDEAFAILVAHRQSVSRAEVQSVGLVRVRRLSPTARPISRGHRSRGS
jgi:hypothetical protein